VARADDQVKIRGFRIELGEIEAALATCAGVAVAAAAVREDEPGDRRLVGYVVPAAGAAGLNAAGVRAAVALVLPEYMVPSAVVVLETLPVTVNGKLDRRALPAPDYKAQDYLAPRTPVEQTIADIWTRHLGVEAGVHDNFFDLGGHSLLAIRVTSDLRNAFAGTARPVGVMDMFTNPTVAGLAALFAEGRDDQARPEHPGQRLLYELTPPVAEPTLSMVCAPYAGGSAGAYQSLARVLPAGTSLYAIQLPGHDPELDAKFLPVEEVADACAAEILRQVRGPLVLYGHCVGTALAIAIARRLEAAGRPLDGLYLGALFPLLVPAPKVLGGPVSWLLYAADWLRGDRREANALIRLGADLAGLDLDRDQRRFLMRTIRMDSRLARSYLIKLPASSAAKLRVRVISVVGARDRGTRNYRKRSKEWAFLSDSVTGVVLDNAGHYFLNHQAEELAAVLTQVHRNEGKRPILARIAILR
jgi:surfactin synthase thioesterase subunit